MEPGPSARNALRASLGYLNFSGGAPDAAFRAQLNGLFAEIEASGGAEPPHRVLDRWLAEELAAQRGASATFSTSDQAAEVLRLAFDRVLPGYREHHRDLLQHQSDESLYRPYFLARVFEAVLQQEAPWDEPRRIVAGALGQLNDFLGHRPVAVLRNGRKTEPYAHEWVCPIPLYFRESGVACGEYRELVDAALAILRATEPGILDLAHFDVDLLDELALDPRAYDFDHPANRRPNYQFGQWDPHRIDNAGRYRRFVLVQVTLDALVARVADAAPSARGERVFESAAVLAGTILMAAGVSGRGPEAHDSATTLATLMPRIAGYRDAFYSQLLARVEGPHGDRLRAEAQALRQPFGGARQDLNARLALLRATQLQHVHLAQLFAQMGFGEASARQSRIVPVASARMLCEINGRITAAHLALDAGDMARAAPNLAEIQELLRRAIECGAMVDPWNILGFQGQFSLFPALENSVRDHRIDVLIHLVRQLFGLYARTLAEAAAAGQDEVRKQLTAELGDLAARWDRFASTEVSGVEHVSGREAVDSAENIAAALGAWHRAGAAAGDIAFWRKHSAHFASPRAYRLVAAALVEKRDFIAAMALLVQWLSQADRMPLEEGDESFQRAAFDWLNALYDAGAPERPDDPHDAPDAWALATKFLDYVEANAGEYWEVPRFIGAESAAASPRDVSAHDPDGDEDEEAADELFSAAWEGVTYRDTTRDGVEGETLEGGAPASDYELDLESDRLERRLDFLVAVARLWRTVALHEAVAGDRALRSQRREPLLAWSARALQNRRNLLALLESIHRHAVPPPSGSHESLVEFDRRRMVKEGLLARTIGALVATSDAVRLTLAAADDPGEQQELAAWEREAVRLWAPLLSREPARARERFPEFKAELSRQTILYVPLAKGGSPQPLAAAQSVKELLVDTLTGLPRLGMLAEACQLLATAADMERQRPDGPAAITEFDRLFEAGYRALVESLVAAAERWRAEGDASGQRSDAALIDCLDQLTNPLLQIWLDHSRQVRLSALERLADNKRWNALVDFIQRYGHDLFTQRFMNLGNLRAILHQGVDNYLDALVDEGEPSHAVALVAALEDGTLSRVSAAEQLTLALEAVVENYGEYKDFNTTTTQSDRGELLYTLLDFLRLKSSYVRVAWNLRPVATAHEVLVRRGASDAAELWRRAMAERTSEAADWHLARLAELEQKHGLRLPTISDRLNERFIRPLAIDRLRALVPLAILQRRNGSRSTAFEELEQQIEEFTERPAGSGLDVPGWLLALEHEAGEAPASSDFAAREADAWRSAPPVALTLLEVQRQLTVWQDANPQ